MKPSQKNKLIPIAERFAEELRNNATPAENHCLSLLEKANIQFLFQHVLFTKESFIIVDFYLPELNLCLELDGSYHYSCKGQIEKDSSRDWWLRDKGYRTLRLKNKQVMSLTVRGIMSKLKLLKRKKHR